MTTAWTLNAGQLAAMAAQRVQMVGEGETLTGYRWTVWMNHANGLLKLLQTQGPNQWRRTTQTVTLVSGTKTYTLSPRPDKVHLVVYTDANSRDRPLARWNYNQYEILPYKSQTGSIVMYVEDRQLSSTTLTFWPVPDDTAATGSVRVSYERVINTITSPSDALDIPDEWMDCLADLSGARLASSFRVENPSAQLVLERGENSLQQLLGYDREDAVWFTFDDPSYTP